MGGTPGEADGSEEVDILAVFEQLQHWGWGYKNGCILGTVGLINTKFGHSIPGGVPYHQVASFSCDDIMGMHMGARNASQMHFLVENKERYNLACEGVLPECSYVVPSVIPCQEYIYSSSLPSCERMDPLFVAQNSLVKLEFFTQHCHHDVLWRCL